MQSLRLADFRQFGWSQLKSVQTWILSSGKGNGSDVVPWAACLIYGRGEISLDLPDIHAHLENEDRCQGSTFLLHLYEKIFDLHL